MDEPLILERYRPLEPLGEGGHGAVTLAFDTRMSRRVAIKSIPLSPKRSDAGLEEARTAAMLNHPSIVTVHEWDADGQEAHVIMEHVDGVDLGRILDEYGRLAPRVAAAVLSPVADALAFAHQNGVLHLDIKPGNVLIDRDGRVKVADFGISALTDAAGNVRGVHGTLGYMPPEQLQREDLDEAADVWAFGVLAYEMLTDANPFNADTLEAAAFKAEYSEIPAPSEFESDIDAAIDDILLAAIDPDPAQRYPSISGLADALLSQLGEDPQARAELAELVDGLMDDEEFDPVRSLGLWDRIRHFHGPARRVVAAVLCGWLGWAGLAPLGLGDAPTIGAALFIAAAGAAMPQLGLALGLIGISVGFFSDGIMAGIVFAIAAGAYWVWLGRDGTIGTFAPVMAPIFGIVPGSFGLPLLLGFTTSPVTAALLAGWSAGSLHVASAMNGADAPYLDVAFGLFTQPWSGSERVSAVAELFSSPGPVAAIVAWALAAALVSLGSRSGTRTGAVVGVVAALFVLVGGYAVWGVVDPSVVVDGGPVLEHVGGSLILMTVVIGLGAPVRGAAS